MPLLADLPPAKAVNARTFKTLHERDRMAVVPDNYKLVTTTDDLEEIVRLAYHNAVIAVDTETTGTEWWRPGFDVSCIGIATDYEVFIIPTRMVNADVNFDAATIREYLGDMFEDPEVMKVYHNAQFDIHALRQVFGIESTFFHDTMVAAKILDENQRAGLEAQAKLYLGREEWKIKQDGNFGLWPMKLAQVYLGGDVENTMLLFRFQQEALLKLPTLENLYYNVEVPHVRELIRMEQRGIHWDHEYFENVMKPEVLRQMEEAKEKALELLGPINLDSPAQVANVLYEGLKLPRGEGDSNSVDKAQLARLRGMHPSIAALTTYRNFGTINKMFVQQLPEYVHNGKIHPSFNPIGAATGRLSCRQPNLQQLPKRMGPLVRRAFIPAKDHVLVTFDYSQIELRILAHLSQDEGMIAAFESGQDFHTMTAHKMFDIPIEKLEADKDMPERITAKNINFGIPYGIGARKLANTVNLQLQAIGSDRRITEEEAKKSIDAYFEAYPGVKAFISQQKALYAVQAYVETILGRKRRLYESHESGLDSIYASGARQAVNAPIQGSSADMIKMACVKIAEHIRQQHWPYALLLSIHDELVLEVPKDWFVKNQGTLDTLKEIMAGALPLSVPIKVSADILSRWGDKVPDEDLEFDEEELV